MLVERSLIKATATHCLVSIVSLVSDTVSVENVSSAETLTTDGPAPKINQIGNNALLVSSEKVKIKIVSEILSLKVEHPRRTPRAQNPLGNQLGRKKTLPIFLHRHICLRAKV